MTSVTATFITMYYSTSYSGVATGRALNRPIGISPLDQTPEILIYFTPLAPVGYSSGQRGQTVNLLAYAFQGSNPCPTTIQEAPANAGAFLFVRLFFAVGHSESTSVLARAGQSQRGKDPPNPTKTLHPPPMTAAATPPRPYRREATGAVPFGSNVAGAEEIDDGADGWEGVALGWRETDIEYGFELVTKLDHVEGVASKVTNKCSIEPYLRQRKVEVPRDDGLDTSLNGFFHLSRILPRTC